MKAMVIIEELRLGGAERMAIRMSDALVRRGHTVAFVAADGVLADELPSTVIMYRTPPFSIFRLASIINALRTAIKDFKPNVIHSHSATMALLSYAALLILRLHFSIVNYPKIILQIHQSRIGKIPARLAAILLNHVCNHILSLTESQLKYLALVGIRTDRMSIMPNFINICEFTAKIRSYNTDVVASALAIPPDGYVVSCIGRLAHQKGFEDFLTVMQILLKRNKEIYGVIVGDGPLYAYLRELAVQQGVDRNIRFAGYTQEIEKFLAISKVFVSISSTEVLPLALIEAVVAGIPVVCSDIPPHRAIITNNENGYCLPYNLELFAQTIEEIQRSKTRSSSLPELLRQKFDEETAITRLIALYNN